MRNEQSASYAAQAAGYLTGRPQACLVVSGPGVIHGLAGLANAEKNCWPMILIGGASPTYQNGMGAFQEERQVALAEPYCKYAHAVEHVARIPYYVEQAVRSSIYGRPGPVYLDMPDDIIRGEIEEEQAHEATTVPEPPRSQASPEDIEAALSALESAERPLVIVGKGMAWSRAEQEIGEFIERTQLPFLASPMGKGVLPDGNPLSVGAARSLALREADLVFLMGARFNWIMHFGLPPRFDKNVRVIQLDISPEEIGTNVPTEVALVGDGKAIVGQLNSALNNRQWFYPAETSWRAALKEKADENLAAVEPMEQDDSSPMNYYRAFRDIQEWLPEDAIIVGEGANTMDIGRTQMLNTSARHHGHQPRLHDRRRSRQSRQTHRRRTGRFGVRLFRHGTGNHQPLQPAHQADRAEQWRYRWRHGRCCWWCPCWYGLPGAWVCHRGNRDHCGRCRPGPLLHQARTGIRRSDGQPSRGCTSPCR